MSNSGKKTGKIVAIMIGAIVFAAIIVGIAVFYVFFMPSIKAKKQIDVAREYLDDGEFEMAIAAFEDAISIDPKSEDAYLELADLYIELADSITDSPGYSLKQMEAALDVLESSKAYIKSSKIDDKIEEVEDLRDQYEGAIEILKKEREERERQKEEKRKAEEAAAAAAALEAQNAKIEDFQAVRERYISEYGFGYDVGQMLPECYFWTLDGDAASTTDFLGKPLYINMFTTWCPYCDMEVPDMQSTYDKYQSDIQYIMIDLAESPNDASGYARDFGLSIPMYLCEDWALGDLPIQGVPTTFVLDKYGRIVDFIEGMAEASWIENATVKAINESK